MYEEYRYNPLFPGDPYYLPPDIPSEMKSSTTEDGLPDRWGCLLAIAGWLLFILLFAILVAFTSCTPQRIVVEYRDSVRTEVRTETVYVPDTVTVFLPDQSVTVLTPDTTSHLETDFAVSEATILDGLLYHSLRNKPTPLHANVQHKETVRDSIVYRDREVPILIPAPATVSDASASQPSWFQQLRLWLGTITLIAILLTAGWGIFRILKP